MQKTPETERKRAPETGVGAETARKNVIPGRRIMLEITPGILSCLYLFFIVKYADK
ncbi:MAG: hypothetical protein K6E78_06945 [Treponema sp.]|nr:hypothetical protein [Treponema sp.]